MELAAPLLSLLGSYDAATIPILRQNHFSSYLVAGYIKSDWKCSLLVGAPLLTSRLSFLSRLLYLPACSLEYITSRKCVQLLTIHFRTQSAEHHGIQSRRLSASIRRWSRTYVRQLLIARLCVLTSNKNNHLTSQTSMAPLHSNHNMELLHQTSSMAHLLHSSSKLSNSKTSTITDQKQWSAAKSAI